ncbi:MAG: hypothetical protein IT382_04080 [Deltaproteobacteria bacterium]|nr:hypothetical protein [Deltaproteobacteria bacterium]
MDADGLEHPLEPRRQGLNALGEGGLASLGALARLQLGLQVGGAVVERRLLLNVGDGEVGGGLSDLVGLAGLASLAEPPGEDAKLRIDAGHGNLDGKPDGAGATG